MNARTSNWDAEEAFFRAMWEWLRSNYTFPDMPSSADPITVLERQKTEQPAEAGKGLREAVRDLIEMTGELSGPELDAIDRYLKERGAPTLTAFRLPSRSAF